MSVICARLGSKGKVGVQRGRKTAGCPSFLPPRRAPRRSRRPQTANPPVEVQRKTPRPERANTPAAVRVPRSAGAEKEPPVRANTLTLFECPAGSVQKRSRPLRANPPAAVRVPRWVGAEKEPPVRGEPACGSSRTPLGQCRKSGKSRKNFPARKGSKNARSHAEKTSIRTV